MALTRAVAFALACTAVTIVVASSQAPNVTERACTATAPSAENAGATTTVTTTKTPEMPPLIRAMIHEDWAAIDPEGPRMIEEMKQQAPVLAEFSHARTTFKEHLLGTFSILGAWKQPAEVRRTGLFHTGYSGDLFQFFVWDATSSTARDTLRHIVGTKAERLTWLFGTVSRGSLLGLRDVMNASVLAEPGPALSAAPEAELRVTNRLETTSLLSGRDVANLVVVTIADYLEQMVEVNGWRDIHQVEAPTALYPGGGQPAVALYWASAMCRAVREQLEVRRAARPPSPS